MRIGGKVSIRGIKYEVFEGILGSMFSRRVEYVRLVERNFG